PPRRSADRVEDGLARRHPLHDVAKHVLGGVELRLLGEVAAGRALGEPRLAGELGVEAGHDPEQRRLARAIGAEDADLGVGVEGQRDVLQHLPPAVGLGEALHMIDELPRHGPTRAPCSEFRGMPAYLGQPAAAFNGDLRAAARQPRKPSANAAEPVPRSPGAGRVGARRRVAGSPMRQLCFLLVVCCAAAIGPALAPAAAQQRVILTPDADYPEHDIGTVDGVDLDGCQQACLAEPRCLAFTHDASARRCYLKNDHGELRSMPGATAGRLVEGAALTPSLERQRLSELGFLDDGLKVEARRFAEALPARFAAGEMSFGALAAAAEAAWRAGNRAEAVSLYGRALSRAPEDYGVWVRFAGALIAYEPDDWQQRQQNERDAVSAAIQSYLLAT